MRLALMCIIVFCSFNLALSCCGQQRPIISSRTTKTRVGISGGSDAAITDFPWAVAIRFISEALLCGGAIIGKKHILTACHCVKNYEPSDLIVVSGTASVHGNRMGTRYGVLSYICHPDFVEYKATKEASHLKHDIAVLTLKGEIKEDSVRKIISLPSDDLPDYSDCVFAGYGEISPYQEAFVLQKLNLRSMPVAYCLQEHARIVEDYEICTLPHAASGPCPGDSGSALVYKEQVVGIMSIIFGECPSNRPAIFARVFSELNFINDAMRTT